MVIWIVDQYTVPSEYSTRNRTNLLARCLISQGHEVVIISASTIHNTDINLVEKGKSYAIKTYEDGLTFMHIRTMNYRNSLERIVNNLQFSLKMKNVVSVIKKPDVMLLGASPFYLTIPYKLAKRYNCKTVLEVRDLWPANFVEMGLVGKNNLFLKFLFAIDRFNYEKADDIIFSFEGGKKYIYDKKYKVTDNKVHYVSLGVDLSEFKHNMKQYTIEDVDLNNEKLFKIIFTGSIRDIYDIPFLINTSEILCKKNINCKFLIFGSGKDIDIYNQRIQSRKLTSFIEFKGFYDKKYIPYILSKASCLLLHADRRFGNLSSRYGHSNNKSFEYYASGKPIISTLKAAFDPIEKFKCGFIVEDYKPEALAEVIIRCYELNKEELNELGKNSIKASQEFDMNLLLNKMCKIISGGKK